MFDASPDHASAPTMPQTSASGMWQILAMDFSGFYGTRIVVAAADRSEAVERATREADRFARARLAEMGFAYGMSATMPGIEEAIARRRDAFRAEAWDRIEPLAAGAAVLSAPGWHP